MRVVGLDGRSYSWDLTGHVPAQDDEERSEPHLRARVLLKELFPLDRICEEVGLPGSGSLRADFVLPARKLVVEVQGGQHSAFTPFFHGDRGSYLASRKRDQLKADWCAKNGLDLVRLEHDGTLEEWRGLILSR